MDKDYIDKLAYIYIRDKKLLCTLPRGKDTWLNAGGKREAGESDQQALIREVREELSVDLQPETLKYYGTFEAQAHGKPDGTMVRLTCYTGDFTGELKASSEIDKIALLGYAERIKTSVAAQLIFDDLLAKKLIE